MGTDRYAFAGWLAMSQAIIFPLTVGLAVAQITSGSPADPLLLAGEFGPINGLFIVFTALGAYILLMFRCLLNEHYRFNDIIGSFAVITFIAGIAEVSVLFSPITLIIPIWCFLLAMTFLRQREHIESFI